MVPGSRLNYKIQQIDFVFNQSLEDAFEGKKVEFQSKGVPSREILAFHGTAEVNIPGILRNNLQYQVRFGSAKPFVRDRLLDVTYYNEDTWRTAYSRSYTEGFFD